MEIITFLLHFIYISGTFLGGVAIGYIFKEKISTVLSRFFK